MKPYPTQPVSLQSVVLASAALAATIFLGVSPAVQAGGWSGTLQDGSQLYVDPETHRAVRDEGGHQTQMWDGTHRLENGSVVIIKDGTAVPTRGMLETWDAEPGPQAALAQPECERLVLRVCGPQDACGRAGPCLSARKLMKDGGTEGQAGSAEGACMKALTDPAFPVCTQVARGTSASDCTKLVERVCGAKGRCDKSPACDPARQLLGMEAEERSGDPRAITATGAQCREAMVNPFFKACE
jgi:hypothetical protein